MAPTKTVPIQLGDGTKKRGLRFDNRALIKLEEELGYPPAIAFRRGGEASVRAITVLLWAALLHEEPKLKLEDVVEGRDGRPPLFSGEEQDEITTKITLAYMLFLGKYDEAKELERTIEELQAGTEGKGQEAKRPPKTTKPEPVPQEEEPSSQD